MKNPGSPQPVKQVSQFKLVFKSPLVIGSLIIVMLVLTGVGYTFIREYMYRRTTPTQKNFFVITHISRNYDLAQSPPSEGSWFGRDHDGMSVGKRMLAGAYISMLVGVIGALVSVTVGTLYGLISGYAGGKTDMIMMRFVDVVYSLPYMFIVIILISIFTRSVWLLFVALGLVYWLTVARIVRGQVLSIKEREFVSAAKAIGAGHMRIIFRHIFPNLIGIVIVYLTLTIPRLMLQESFLSFLGLNVMGQEHSWGTILNEATISAAGTDWWMILFPGGLMFITLLALTVIGEKLKELYER